MKNYWYVSIILLAVGIISGFCGVKQTTAIVANMPPSWDFPTTHFAAANPIMLNLDYAFFDLDGDKMNYSTQACNGISAEVVDSMLTIRAQNGGTVNITATDGQHQATQEITVHKPQ